MATICAPLVAAAPAVAAQLSLSWSDNATNETGFRIERRLNSSATYAQIATVGTNVTAYVDTTVTGGQTYCYRVRAYNSAGSSDYTNVACATAPVTPVSYTLTVSKAGTGSGTVSGPGIACGTDCSQSVTSGTSVTLTANPAAGSSFAGWSGGCTGTGSCTKTILANTTVTATFTKTSGSSSYMLTVTKAGTGSGTVSGPGISCGTDCSQSMTSGTTVTLNASPAAGSSFAGWTGDDRCTGNGSSCTTTLLANTTITATFKKTSGSSSYMLTVNKAGTGSGTVSGPGIACGTDCSQSVTSGTSVTLTANPAANSTFAGWSGGCTGTGSCTKTILANTTVTATFKVSGRTLTVELAGEGTGTVTGPGISCGTDCSRSVTDNTTLTLIATPADGSTFTGWSGPCSGNGDCTVSVSESTLIGATFGLATSSSAVEIVTGADRGSSPRVRGLTRGGLPTTTDFLAYPPSFTGGVFVALGTLDSEGTPLIATGSGPGIPAEVRAFRLDGSSAGAGFHPYGPSFSGGARVAVCDVDGDGADEIVTAPGTGFGPLVAVWQLGAQTTTRLLSFIAGGSASTNGLFVACGDVDGDGANDIVVGDNQGSAPEVRVYRVIGTRADMIASFVAYEPSFTGGVRVTTTDIDGDGFLEIITAPGPGRGPLVRAFRISGNTAAELTAFDGQEPGFTGGLFVAGGKRDELGSAAAVMVSPGSGGAPRVRIFSVSPTAVIESTSTPIGGPGVVWGITLGASQ